LCSVCFVLLQEVLLTQNNGGDLASIDSSGAVCVGGAKIKFAALVSVAQFTSDPTENETCEETRGYRR
jgi:hypothetical protein